MNDAPSEIKARLSIEELVGQYVQLKKIGRNFKGLCPFHSEKTPSFIVSPDKGIAYCFGCHKGGDIFKFVQEIEGVDFVDALKLLGERTGVKLESFQSERKVSVDEKSQLLQIQDFSADFYRKCLWETEDGKKVLDYLHKRGIQDETVKLFRLGFAPDSYDALHLRLLKEGFTKKMLVLSGMALSQETTFDKIYDRFRGRLMFPVTDSLGRIVGFGGRALKQDQEPKYLNSPETPVYHKSNILYGFSFAKPFIKEQGSAVVVEGYIDVLAAHQAGLKNVVASSGTALTLKQLRLIQPLIDTLFLAFDMDDAGQEAALRAYELARDFEFQVKVLTLPDSKDIAEFAQTRAEQLPGLLQSASYYGDYFYSRLLKTYGSDDLVSKRKILKEFYPFFGNLKSSIEKDSFIRKFAHDLQLAEVQIYDEIKHFKLPMSHPARLHQSDADGHLSVKKYLSDELLLGFMIEFPRIALLFKEKFTEELFHEEIKPIYKAFFAYYNGPEPQEGSSGFIAFLPPQLAEKAGLLSLYVGEYYGEMGEETVEHEVKVLLDSIKRNHLNKKRRDLQLEIMEAEKGGNKDLRKALLQELDQFI